MGWLLSKLQITSSGDRVANAVFSKPLMEMTLPSKVRDEFTENSSFEPSPNVPRNEPVRHASNPAIRCRNYSPEETGIGRLSCEGYYAPSDMVYY
jgi:hypothetical protein